MDKINYMFEFIKIFDEWSKIESYCQEVTSIRAQLVDLNGKFIIGQKNLSPFCQYISKSAVGSIRCHECYQKNSFEKNILSRGYNIFKCHAGLTNFSIIIFLDNEPIGAIIGGGVIIDKDDLWNCNINIQELKLDRNLFIEKLENVKNTTYSNIENTARMLKNVSVEFNEMLIPYYKQLEIILKLSSESEKNNIFMKDELTGLLCKQYFLYRLKEEIDRSHRYNIPFCVLMLRIDNLTDINHTHGYIYGDTVIRNTMDIVKSTLRKVDTLYRYDGNIFTILASCTLPHQSIKLIDRIKNALEKNQSIFNLKEQESPITLSFGIAPYSSQSNSAEIMILHSKQALEEALINGPHTIKIYESPSRKKNKRRVVVTGIGTVAPIGIGKEAFLKSLLEGTCGINKITLFDPSNFPCKVAGEVKNFLPELYMTQKILNRTARSSQFAIAASKMAVQDAGIENLKDYDTKRISVIIGSAIAGLEFGEEQYETFIKHGVRKISPFLSVIVFAGMVSSEVSIELGVKGRSATISTGCTAGNDAIGYAFQNILDDESDIIITGGVEAPLRPVILASFCSMKAVSTHFNDTPDKSSRPFDKLRDGFVLSEGGGIVILEELQHALRRGAHIYAEVLGYDATDDAFHVTQPAPNGESAARAINNAIEKAGISKDEVDYINAHGSSTPLNDSTETKVMKDVFGKRAYSIPISSTKSMQGHPLGASGALEFITSVLAIEYGFLPPTINYQEHDPLCDLGDYVSTGARKKVINTVISNNFGFGGKNASLVMRKY